MGLERGSMAEVGRNRTYQRRFARLMRGFEDRRAHQRLIHLHGFLVWQESIIGTGWI